METISAHDLCALLVQAGAPEKLCYLFDRLYVLPTDEEVEAVLRDDRTNLDRFTPEINDCDNFALRVMAAMSGRCFGMAIVTLPGGGLHAVNIYVNTERRVRLIEPQTDQAFTGYTAILGVMFA